MLDKQKLLEWLDKQTENPRITKDMAIILGVVYGLIETGVFDCNQQWKEEVHTITTNHNESQHFHNTFTTGHNENETVVVEYDMS